jgi:RNA polymerase sigma-70 factor (ECF subfamily)
MSWNQNDASDANTAGIEHTDGLYSYALVLTRNHADAEDLVQETYVRAMQAVSRLRPDSNIKGWLFTILRNVWLNQLRKQRSGPQFVDVDVEAGIVADLAAPTKNSHDFYVSKLEKEQVQAAIQKLPLEFREIILLREYEELSYQEIAIVLDCPAGTVMSRLGRARTKLRTLLSTLNNRDPLNVRGTK